MADTWGESREANVALAIEGGYRDGLKRAAAFIEEKGQQELAAAESPWTLRRCGGPKSKPARPLDSVAGS